VSEGEETTGRTDRATGRARPVAWPDRWARIVRERGEGRGFNQGLKTEFDKKKRAFLEKGFSTPI
jgi:hypothetical protein